MTFTPAQEQVLSFSGNVSVLAGAGSGKTLTLVERVVRLLAGQVPGVTEPVDITSVLALTYTEKAAREMRDRLRRALVGRMESDPENRAFWSRQRRLLDRSLITTIHGFCLQTLKAHALEAGLDPDGRVLDPAREFWGEAGREALLDHLMAESGFLLELLDFFPWPRPGSKIGLDQLVDALIRHGRTSGRDPRPADPGPFHLSDALADLEGAVHRIDDLILQGAVSSKHKYYAHLKAFQEAWAGLAETADSVETWLARVGELEAPARRSWYKANDVRALAQAGLEKLKSERDRRRAEPLMNGLRVLADQVDLAVAQAKERARVLDFDDLLLFTRDLLNRRIDVRLKLQDRFRMVLMDEFQDTNRLQADILALLTRNPSDGELRPGRLMVFGDPKQSIYRFRGAEVQVFEALQEDIQAAGGRLVSLDANFRSQKRLIDFFNAFFQENLTGTAAYEARYGPADVQSGRRGNLGPSGPGAFILATDEGENAAQEHYYEADGVARYLEALLGDPAPWVAREDQPGSDQPDPGRPVMPRDVAVLLRQFTHLKLYEQAFTRRGLPFYTVRGQGFFQCPEVWDLVNLIRFLADPRSGPALLGVLRSPLAGLDDGLLTRLAWPDKDRGPLDLSGWFTSDQWSWPLDLGPDQLQAARRTRDWLSRLVRDSGRAFPAELLERAVEETDYLAVLLAGEHGEQKAANVQKFIETARTLRGEGLTDVRSLARVLAQRLTDAKDDPEAQSLAEDTQAIRIMTIHQAKGLEFPVVIVPETGRPVRVRAPNPLIGPNDRFTLRFRDPDTHERLYGPNHQAYLDDHQIRETAEHLRLLYVAATRAQDHLVFSGCLEKAKPESWLGRLTQFADQRPDLLGRAPIPDRTPVRPTDALDPRIPAWDAIPGDHAPFPDLAAMKGEPAAGPLPPAGAQAGNDAAAPDVQAERVLARALDLAPWPAGRITLEVTGMTQYLVCPRRFFFETLLGLTPFGPPEKDVESGVGETGGMSARDRGNLFHQAMEDLDLLNPPEEPGLYDHVWKTARTLNLEAGSEALEAVSRRLAGFLASDWGREMRTCQPGRVWREAPVWILIPGEGGGPDLILTGEIDLFYITPGGSARVVDYKYARPKDTGRYAPQVRQYALALSRAGLRARLGGGLYFAAEESGRAVDIPLEPGWEKDFEAELRRAALGLARMAEPGSPPPDPPGVCPDPACGFGYTCGPRNAAPKEPPAAPRPIGEQMNLFG